MPPIETSFFELAYWLMRLLVYINLAAIAIGICTLPLFYVMMISIVQWFTAKEDIGSLMTSDEGSEGNGRTFSRTILGPVYFLAFPLVSILANIYLLGMLMPRWVPLVSIPISSWSVEERFVLALPAIVFGPFPMLLILFAALFGSKGLSLILRSLNRNLLRTSLTYLAIFVLVSLVTSVWSILAFLDQVTQEKEQDFKVIITEKYQIPSQMKPSHIQTLKNVLKELPTEYHPKNGEQDIMTWAFVGCTLDPANRTFEKGVFFFAMEPDRMMTMMDGLDELTDKERSDLDQACKIMTKDPTKVVIGTKRLQVMGKRIGDIIELTSINYKDITFRVEIIGEFPEGRYEQSALMNRKLLDDAISAFERSTGRPHPLAERCLNLIWLRLPTKKAYDELSKRVNGLGDPQDDRSGLFSPPIKLETASSGIGSFLEAWRDVIWGMKYLLSPAIFVTMCLIISNAISISVRERRSEMAVLKVLGFRPWMVMALVFGEAVLIGAIGGYLSNFISYFSINARGGIPFPIAFFPKFFIPKDALWWGLALGTFTAILGSLLPAWSARTVKVSEVFARVA